MADVQTDGTRITGEDLVGEILRNLEQGLFKIRYSTLVPCVFRVYLHANDYDPLRGAMPYLTAEIVRALHDKLNELNGTGGKLSALLGRFRPPAPAEPAFRILHPDFSVEFLPDPDGQLARGEIEVYSELGAPPKAEYGAGSTTRRIVRPLASAEPLPEDATRATTAPLNGELVYGQLRYEDQSGAHVYAMTKNEIVIGRGGKGYWVDVKLQTLPDVSREHCRLRRDPESGQFFLRDLSQYGTTLDGHAVPPSLAIDDRGERDTNREVPVPPGARIGLADVVFLVWEPGDRL